MAALILRPVHRIGQHALTDRWLWGIAIASGIAQGEGANFLLILLVAGGFYLLVQRGQVLFAKAMAGVAILGFWIFSTFASGFWMAGEPIIARNPGAYPPDLLDLFIYGLRSGVLTSGGAYTVIPFLQRDAVPWAASCRTSSSWTAWRYRGFCPPR